MKRGDATSFWICNGCGRIPIYNEAESLFVCPTCDGPLTYSGVTPETLTLQLPTKQSRATFSKIAIPYSLKLLDQELTAFANAGFRFVADGAISRLREADWNWPTMEVEFKAGERGVEEAAALNPEAAAAAAAVKPKRKKGTAAVSTDLAVVEDAQTVRFANKLDNEFVGLSSLAPAPFRITGPQIPASDGTVYPELGVAADGSIDVAKQTWPTAEQYYQAMKFPTDPDWQEAIRLSPAKAKAMGSDPAHALRGDWEQVKDRVMKTALLAKFQQNPPLLALLQSTGERRLADASADKYWGSKGANKLGLLMEEVRKELGGERPDLGGLSSSPPEAEEQQGPALPPVPEAGESEEAVGLEGMVNAAKLASGGQQGGVYLFINSAPRGQIESKARRGRDRGQGRKLAWEGMSGGGDVEEMTTGSGSNLEVSVEKLGV